MNCKLVHKALVDKLNDISLKPELYELFKEILTKLKKDEEKIQESVVSIHKKKLFKVEQQITKLQERVLDTDDPELVSFYENKIKELIQERIALKEKSTTTSKIGI